MAIKIVIVMQDDAPPQPFVEPIEVRTTLTSPEVSGVVDQFGDVNRPLLQSYLMLATKPLADAYEAVIASSAAIAKSAINRPPALPTTLAPYKYSWPDPDIPEPQPGQAIHPRKALDMLRVAHIDAEGADRAELFGLVVKGDVIGIGTTTWTVEAVTHNGGYSDFVISPPVPAAFNGPAVLLFGRPDRYRHRR